MAVRGIRGATTVLEDSAEEILSAARELLLAICTANPSLEPGEIASIFFTVTSDLRAAFPAKAARDLGWDAPLLDALEIPVPGSLPRCIRVLIHWNTELTQEAARHVYLREAARLRPDLAQTGPAEPPVSNKQNTVS